MPDSLDALTLDHPMIAFWKQHLSRYGTRLVTGSYDAKMVEYLDMVGKMHTPEAESADLDVPLVQMNALLGFVAAALVKTGMFSQPRNLVGGNAISGFVGVAVATNIALPSNAAFAAAVAVSSSVLFMHLTRSMHLPGGATALIAVVGGDGIRELGYWYVLFPVLGGSLMLLAVALVVNNLSRNPHRHYPI